MHIYPSVDVNVCNFFLNSGPYICQVRALPRSCTPANNNQNSYFLFILPILPSSTALRAPVSCGSVAERGNRCVLLNSDFQMRAEG